MKTIFGKSRGTLAGVSILLAISLAQCGCTSGENGADRRTPAGDLGRSDLVAAGGPVRVVATYSILGDWVRTVGGDRIELTVLVGPEGDAHTYEPTPRDSVSLAEADVIFENGLGFEVWLDRLFEASGSKAKRVVVTERIEPRELAVSASRTEIDPHVWHLPENAMVMVEAVTSALERADPDGMSGYRDRHAAYVGQLQELDAWISRQTASIPEDRRKLVTTHDTFGYLADRYGFEVLSVLGSVSSESSDPSARQVAEIIDRIRELKIPAVFAENILNPRLTRTIAAGAGVQIVPTLYTDALGPADSPGGDYLGMMRFNVKTIAEALR